MIGNLRTNKIARCILFLALIFVLATVFQACTHAIYGLKYSDNRLVSMEDYLLCSDSVDEIFINNGFKKIGIRKYQYLDDELEVKYNIVEIKEQYKTVRIVWYKKKVHIDNQEERPVSGDVDKKYIDVYSLDHMINKKIEEVVAAILNKEVQIIELVFPTP